MEAKLRALRVADLRDILQKASVTVPAKSNKSDLIAKILASPAAVDAFNNQGSSALAAVPASKSKPPASSQGEDDLLAPPEEFDWGSTSAPNRGAAASGAPASAAVPKLASGKADSSIAQPKQSTTVQPPSASKPATLSASAAGVNTDDEEEKRKQRAARFNIPLVEVKPKAAPASNGVKAPPRSQPLSAEDVAKAEARAARFDLPRSSATSVPIAGQKRPRSSGPVDIEELEKRRKRAARFAAGGQAKT